MGMHKQVMYLQSNACTAAGAEEPGAAVGPTHACLYGGALLPELLLLLPLATHPLQEGVCL